MNVLESPLDTLLFDYPSFGFLTIVNNLWTWVALLMAAVSFWMIRAVTAGPGAGKSEPRPLQQPACIERDLNLSQPVLETSLPHDQSAIKPVLSFSAPASILLRCEDNGVTKGKFVAYYEDDIEEECNDDANGYCDGDSQLTEVGDWVCNDERGEWRDSWERALKVRLGDMSWYRYQDLTAINGNVVRIWDGVRRERYSSGCLLW